MRDNFFNGSEFRSLYEINQKSLEWLHKVNHRIHGATHEKPIERLKKENLVTVSGKFYDLSKVYYRKVQMDCHFSFKANFYSCPMKYAGKEVVIKEMDKDIFVYYRDERIVVHKFEDKFKGGYITSPAHYLEIKEITQKQSRDAWRSKRLIRNNKKRMKEVNKPEYQRSGFNSGQVIKLFQEVEKRDLKIYEEVIQ